MSAKWRQRNNRTNNPQALPTPETGDVASSYVLFDPSVQRYAYYQGGSSGLDLQSVRYPVQHEINHVEAQRYTPTEARMGNGEGNDTFNMIDREIGGNRGWIDNVPYTTGVVSSDLVENYALDGSQAVIRRGRNPSDHGPVGTSDYNGQTSLAYAMTVNQYYPNESSQSDLVRAI